jgi:WD40 repeat protein
VNELDWNKKGNIIISVSLDGTLKTWNLEQPFEISYEICNYGPWQTPFTPENKYFAAPASDKKLVIYEAANGKPFVNLGEQSGLCADFSNDGKLLTTASFDGIVRVFDVVSGKETKTFQGHSSRVDGVAFLSSARKIVSVGDTTLRVWSLDKNNEEKILSLNESVFRVDVTPDEKKVIVAFNSGLVKIIETINWTETGSFNCKTGIQEITVSPDGKTLAAFSGKNIELWNLGNSTIQSILKGHEKPGYGIGFSPDGNYLVSGSYDQTFKLWNLQTNVCTLTFHGFEDTIYSCKILSENEIFLSSSQGKIWFYRF